MNKQRNHSTTRNVICVTQTNKTKPKTKKCPAKYQPYFLFAFSAQKQNENKMEHLCRERESGFVIRNCWEYQIV